MARKHDSDETVVVRRPVRTWRRYLPIAGACVMALSLTAGAINLWRHTPATIAPADAPIPPSGPSRVVAVQPVVAPAAVVVAAEFPVTLATEAEILADLPQGLSVFRFRANPAVIVLDFASLSDQAAMLNRMAVFEEKDGYPHDRVLDDADLDRAIRGGGDDPATFYYGHDYRASALVRFFVLADRDGIRLNAQEERLRRLIAQLGWTAPDANGALISLPRLAADATIDADARATILRHELSHGEYFTNPAYAAFVQGFWRNTLTPGERGAFHKFLVSDHYDGAIEDLMINEGQAYLIHTRDARFFTAAYVGMTAERVDALRESFISTMPKGWLRDATLPPRPVALPARAPRRRRRSVARGRRANRYGLAGTVGAWAVSRTRASTLIRSPRRFASASAAVRSAR